MAREIDNSSILEELHENEEELRRDEKRVKLAFLLGMVFMLAAIAASSYFIIQSVANKSTQTLVKVIEPSITITPTPTEPLVLTTPTSSPLAAGTANETFTKDYYVNLGSGTNKSTDWEDVAGTLITVDLGLYNNVKEVRLETTTNVPTANGTISIRLFNKSDNYAVWNSERTVQAQANGSLLISEKLIYDLGPKLYQIQMKSQLGVLANLLQARFHIIAQ
ncbi:MAG: hypothetical protein WD992_00905 [Candidatus Levyibacteriota bacterium]